MASSAACVAERILLINVIQMHLRRCDTDIEFHSKSEASEVQWSKSSSCMHEARSLVFEIPPLIFPGRCCAVAPKIFFLHSALPIHCDAFSDNPRHTI